MLSIPQAETSNLLQTAVEEVEKSEQAILQNRYARRYPIELEMDYKILYQKSTIYQGRAVSINISSKGFLLKLFSALPSPKEKFVGSKILITVPWPISHYTGTPLKFTVEGRVCRIDANGTIVAVYYRTYEFQTSSSN